MVIRVSSNIINLLAFISKSFHKKTLLIKDMFFVHFIELVYHFLLCYTKLIRKGNYYGKAVNDL